MEANPNYKNIATLAVEWQYGKSTIRENLKAIMQERPELEQAGRVERRGCHKALWIDAVVQNMLHERLERNGARVVTMEQASWRAELNAKDEEIKQLYRKIDFMRDKYEGAQATIQQLQSDLHEQKQLQQQLQLTAETAEHEAQRALDEKQRALDEKQHALEAEQARRLTWRERLTGHKLKSDEGGKA